MPIYEAKPISIRHLFDSTHTFSVPKYQRGYAWDKVAIEHFTGDLSKCLEARESRRMRRHFFGAVIVVRPERTPTRCEAIDGQQRLASFVMLVAAVVHGIEKLIADMDSRVLSRAEKKARRELESIKKELRREYLIHISEKADPEESFKEVEEPKMTLSMADNDFFQKTISGERSQSRRASHERIKKGWRHLVNYVDSNIFEEGTTRQKINRLKFFKNEVLAKDCSIVAMWLDDSDEAYQIFRVLNKRGVRLATGDLLRSSTLEQLDDGKFQDIQEQLAREWDSILAYPAEDVEKYLMWYYSSYEGDRPNPKELADQFLDTRFKCADGKVSKVSKKMAETMLEEVKQMDADFEVMHGMIERGKWPYEGNSRVKAWDRERLQMLTVHMKHTNVMPLLLSLQTLDEKKFANAVAILERFLFRFKVIGKAHIGPATDLYIEYAERIRNPRKSFSVAALRKALDQLMREKVSDDAFKANLTDFVYTRSKIRKVYIRYFLITLEDYMKWYKSGAEGEPRCIDKSRPFDFSSATLEHVYPQTARAPDKKARIEEVKHTLGNLTILAPGENSVASNKPFSEKRKMFRDSSMDLSRGIGRKRIWDEKRIKDQTKYLVKIALKVFVP